MMLRRYRLYSTRRDGRLTTDRVKWRLANPASRSQWIVRASSMREVKELIEKEEWAAGPREPGLLRRLLGYKRAEWEVADYLQRED